MSKLLITTQVYENYGNADEPYWKPKGGSDYVVRGVDQCDMLEIIVDRVRAQVEVRNHMYEEYVNGYVIVADDYLTEFEQSQLDYEGTIRFPAKEITV